MVWAWFKIIMAQLNGLGLVQNNNGSIKNRNQITKLEFYERADYETNIDVTNSVLCFSIRTSRNGREELSSFSNVKRKEE